MARARVLIAIALAAALAGVSGCTTVGAQPASASRPAARAAAFQITGYAEVGETTNAQLDASAKTMTMVGVDGVSLTADGDGITNPTPAAIELLAEAHARHEKAELLVSNYSDDIGDFDDALAEKMFARPDRMDDVVAGLAAEVTRHGWDGITVDLEALNGWGDPDHARDDNAGLDSFLAKLKAALGRASVSICLTATTDSYADLGYDLTTIATQANHVVLMAYDQHGPTWSNAGPIGGYPWAKSSLTQLLTGVPAAKVQLGIAGYGYSWAHGKQQKTADQYTDAQARAWVRAHHASAHWDATQKEWHATASNGTTIWWSDARSYAVRVALARTMHLGGVAVWSLGQSDPLT